ncbi:DUF3261 domain-containing protein [Pseudoduganella sp. SL102]|uniref:DUF3261 domain-containing protein n=1 Tax=Pseudoduganella sp. SL102 TaxID=2995154 RepID=UPI0035A32E3C
MQTGLKARLRAWSNRRLVPALVLAAALAGCASSPPVPARLGLKLHPAALGQSISVQQHLKVERAGRIDDMDVALQVEPEAIDMVGLAFGQRVLTVHYDGKEVKEWRHVMLPRQVRADDVLEDMQLTLWPVEAVARALPPGWRIAEDGLRRTLYLNDEPIMRIAYSGSPRWSGTVVLDNLRYKYRLTIQFAAE